MGLFKKKIKIEKDQVWKRINDNPFIKPKFCRILDVKDGYVLFDEDIHEKEEKLGTDNEPWFRARWTFRGKI